jgi:hypothetical protein
MKNVLAIALLFVTVNANSETIVFDRVTCDKQVKGSRVEKNPFHMTLNLNENGSYSENFRVFDGKQTFEVLAYGSYVRNKNAIVFTQQRYSDNQGRNVTIENPPKVKRFEIAQNSKDQIILVDTDSDNICLSPMKLTFLIDKE